MTTVQAELPSRIERTRAGIDFRRGRGLEIGPLANPIVHKHEADVYYADVLDTAGLLAHYGKDPNVPNEAIVEVDFALRTDAVTRSLAEAAAPAAPYDWLVASHVIEHVPDVIAFLADCAALLKPDGLLALAVPDRRFCFDALRSPTSVGAMLLAHQSGDRRPSVRAVFDHFSDVIHANAVTLWNGEPPNPDQRVHPLAEVQALIEHFATHDEYVDAHVWLFTPAEFVAQLRTLARLGLSDFTVQTLTPTARNELEFYVTLKRLPDSLDADERATAIGTGFPEVVDETPGPLPAPEQEAEPAPPPEIAPLVLSSRELRLIALKRRVLGRLRRRR